MTTDLATRDNEMITTKELAEQLGTSVKVVLDNARKCLPNKEIRNGKPTYWSKEEVTVVLEQMKCNQPNGRTFPNLSVELKGIERCNRDSSITTIQFAKQLGTTPNVVLENARKCLPNKEIQNGKPTYWTKEEVTVILDYMKAHTSNNRSVELNTTVANTSTDMTPALKLRKAMELANEAYQEEIERLKALNIEVLNENGQLKLVAKQAVERAEVAEKETKKVKKDALVIAGWSEQRSVLAYSIAHHLNWNLSKRKEVGKQLSAIARQFNHQVGKVTDRDFGEVNAYGADTWALWESRFRNY